MQLEAGKYYKTRDGRKVGPMKPYSSYKNKHPFYFREMLWQHDGTGYEGKYPEQDIIAEWTDTPAPVTLSAETIDHIAIDSLKYHADKDMEPLQREAFRIVLRYYGVTL